MASLAVVRRYLEARRELDPDTDDFWVDPDGKPMQGKWLYDVLRRYGDQAGIPDLHPHRFRHTFVVAMIRAGVPVSVVEVMGGWERIPKTYLRTLGDEASRQFQGYFSPGDRFVRRTGLYGPPGMPSVVPDNWGMSWPPSFPFEDPGAGMLPVLPRGPLGEGEVGRQLPLVSADVSPNGTAGDWPPSEHAETPFGPQAESEGTQVSQEVLGLLLQEFHKHRRNPGLS